MAQKLHLNPSIKLHIDKDYEIEKDGKIIGVFGKSGCGKTSLLEYLYKQNKKTTNEKVVYMKQDIILHPELTVYETLWFYTLLRRKEECLSIGTMLEKMNMSCLSNGKVKDLSGGEKKRILIAYHLLDETADYFLLDEPFSGIDPVNTELIFSLMKEKLFQHNCTIVMTIHQLAHYIQQQMDEIWTIQRSQPYPTQFQLEIKPRHDEEEDEFQEISLGFSDINSYYVRKTIQPTTTSSFFHQWKCLFLRDRLLDKRNRFIVFLRWTTPLSVVFFQQVLLGSFTQYLHQWLNSNEINDLFKTFLLYIILFFTASISPMHMLNDHFYKRTIIQHEISQGIYRKGVYYMNAILWDQMSLVLISLCIVLMLIPPHQLFSTIFFNIMIQMVFTNMLMWLCSFFSVSTFNMTLVFVTTYISIAFIGNMGLLLRKKSLEWVQYTSIINIQSNFFLEKLYILYPEKSKQLDYISSCLNIHPRHSSSTWFLFSIGLWILSPLFMSLLFFFTENISIPFIIKRD